MSKQIMVITDTPEFKELQEKTRKLENNLNKDIIKNLQAVRTGTINSGDATTDLIIADIRTYINSLHNNVKGQ